MSHAYVQNVIHVVFSTKDRRKTISAEFQPRLWAYAAGICKKTGVLVQAVGGMADHKEVTTVLSITWDFLFLSSPGVAYTSQR